MIVVIGEIGVQRRFVIGADPPAFHALQTLDMFGAQLRNCAERVGSAEKRKSSPVVQTKPPQAFRLIRPLLS